MKPLYISSNNITTSEKNTLTGTTVLMSSSKTPINAMTLSLASYRSTLAIYEEKNSVLNKS